MKSFLTATHCHIAQLLTCGLTILGEVLGSRGGPCCAILKTLKKTPTIALSCAKQLIRDEKTWQLNNNKIKNSLSGTMLFSISFIYKTLVEFYLELQLPVIMSGLSKKKL